MIESTNDSAKFVIFKDNVDFIHEVEWRIGDEKNGNNDDEKYEWNKQEFATNIIEVKGLLTGIKYGIRCRMKLTKDIASDVSKICWFKTKEKELKS